jgi:hypothetical protein
VKVHRKTAYEKKSAVRGRMRKEDIVKRKRRRKMQIEQSDKSVAAAVAAAAAAAAAACIHTCTSPATPHTYTTA